MPYRKYLPPGALVILLLSVYLATLAPGLTWANAGADGGDLIAAAYTGGVAHPTGYPVYLLIARLFQSLPAGSLAFRTNLLSALATVTASVLLYRLVVHYLAPAEPHRLWPAGLLSGLVFGLSPLVWSQAIITEVYALQSLFVVLALYLSVGIVSPGKNTDRWRGLTFGLATGNHLTMLLFLPVAVLSNMVRQPDPASLRNSKLDWISLWRQVTYMVLGWLVYLILPQRALSNPPVNWGRPVTFNRLWWLVSGELYRGSLLPPAADRIWNHIQDWVLILLQQFGFIGLAVALIGLIFFFSSSRLYILSLYLMISSSAFFIAYDSFDSYVYLIPALISFSLWIGLAIGGCMQSAHPYGVRLSQGIGLLLVVYLLSTLPSHWHQVDASDDLRAENFGEEVLASAPANAIVFAKGDQAVFSLWYFHLALHRRPDIAVLATDLLHFDWYQETLRSTYPSLILPAPFPWPETVVSANPLAPVCFVEYGKETIIDCREPEMSR